jgi:bifunctional non-homologous end joining protein LigD
MCFDLVENPMTLATYRKKRQFNKTPEPRGQKVPSTSSHPLIFVIQKHAATRLHYDFRLELDGVLKSWAVPKGPSLDPARKVLAVQVEDHPLDYANFEGIIPKGQYGGGTVLLWDRGTWEPLGDPHEGLAAGKLHFILHGKKLHGEWALLRMHGKTWEGEKNWLLMKIKDADADPHADVTKDEPKSVESSRTIEQIAEAPRGVWSSQNEEMSSIPGAVKAPWPKWFSPELALLVESPPAGDEWLHEIKFDGYRIMARIKSGKVQLMTRHGKDWTSKFPSLAKALLNLKADWCILDGEAVILDDKGRSDFQALQESLKNPATANPVYYVFDLPYCGGFDLRASPLIKRKKELQKILKAADLKPRIVFSEHVIGSGEKLIEKACTLGLEGVVSKRVDSPYVSRRDASWVKSKCGMRQEFVIVGYSDPQGSRKGFGSLLLGYHDKKNGLQFAGRVGTGFNDQMLSKTEKQLRGLQTDSLPLESPPPARERRGAHWIKPELVAEVKFTGWTRDGMLRHPVFVAFRTDKPASEVVRETPVKLGSRRNLSK